MAVCEAGGGRAVLGAVVGLRGFVGGVGGFVRVLAVVVATARGGVDG